MPGLTIVADAIARAPTLEVDRARFAALEHCEGYTTEVLFASPRLFVAATRYAEYPLLRVEDARVVAVLEGRVYDATPEVVARELVALAHAIADEGPSHPCVAGFAAHDGEFVAVAIDRTGDVATVVTDRHGRLPLYRRTRGSRETLSRELGFVVRAAESPRLRRLGVAEFLLFGYPLGAATLYEGVSRVEPASVVVLPGGATRVSHPPVRFGETVAGHPDGASVVERLASGLVAASATRAAASTGPVLVSLSGGLDSRMVAGALRRGGVAARAVTHGDGDPSRSNDVAVAARVAAGLGLPWELHAVPPPTGAEVERLLALKHGANYLGMSRVVPYLEGLRRRHGGGATLFTGDLGDRLLGDRTPALRLRDVRDLADYLLRRETILPLDAVAAMTGCASAELVEAVIARLETYPERELAQRHVHFLFVERAFRWVYEGEDRNRCYCWHTTPFYAPAVFDLAIRVPDRVKAHDALRARVLAALAPEAADVENASTGTAPTGPAVAVRRRAERLARAMLFRTLGPAGEARLRRWLRPRAGHAADSAVLRCIRAQLGGSGPVRDYLRPGAVEAVLDGARDYAREQFSVVLTVTSLIDQLGGGPPVLDAFRDVPMT